MRRVVTPREMADAESLAYAEGCSEALFMDNAGAGVAAVVDSYFTAHHLQREIILLCGKGNNSGDAYVAGCRLVEEGYRVVAYQVGDIQEATPLCKKNWDRFRAAGGVVHPFSDSIAFPDSGVIVDGLFGTGFHGTVQGPYAILIDKANESGLPIIAVDIPSGLNGETGEVGGTAIKATVTAFLGYPKRGFFLHKGWNHVGVLQHVDFGLNEKYLKNESAAAPGDLYLLLKEDLVPHIPEVTRDRHKYQAGYVVAIAGSPHMPGAALLSCTAALKAGAGIVRLFYPAGMEVELSSSPYELIKEPYEEGNVAPILSEFQRASAVIVGPGMGTGSASRKLLKEIIPHLDKPVVIDADALTLYAEEAYSLPPNTIFTPHHGEMARLLHDPSMRIMDEKMMERCQQYVEKHRITLVLKGAPTLIFHPGVPSLISTPGDPGMATAGSGDVLTGIIAAILAQGVPTRFAAALGVYLHGLAGEEAAKQQTSFCMTASDITDMLPSAFKQLELKI
jgi:hydroxyethylthiazole kinase-like uncharacterized protein yjeF